MRKREQVVHDEPEPCPYIEGQVARMPLRWQFRKLDPALTDLSMGRGDRRVGRMLYQTSCPSCTACEPIRIPVQEFRPSRSQKRVIKRNRDVQIEVAPATFTPEKLALYNRHKLERGLTRSETLMTRQGYESWFVSSCVDTIEMLYRVDDRLVGVGIVDLGEQDTSSVYFYFDPDESRRSLGVFSVLMESAWLRKQSGRHHYLGLYVEQCRHLAYKAIYMPHERLVNGVWQRFEGGPDAPPSG